MIKERTCIAKLVKAYILHHPYCTAKQISEWLISNDFGLSQNYSSLQISVLIRSYKDDKHYHLYKWFKDVEWVKKNNKLAFYVDKR